MSRRRKAAPARAGTPRCTVAVCRGCCCGTPKVPGLDHTAQLGQLRRSLPQDAQVRVTGCLGACAHANVIVIQPSPEGRQAGGRAVWLGLVNDEAAVGDIVAWVKAGGPGLADPPDVLDLYAFTPSRRIRQALTSGPRVAGHEGSTVIDGLGDQWNRGWR